MTRRTLGRFLGGWFVGGLFVGGCATTESSIAGTADNVDLAILEIDHPKLEEYLKFYTNLGWIVLVNNITRQKLLDRGLLKDKKLLVTQMYLGYGLPNHIYLYPNSEAAILDSEHRIAETSVKIKHKGVTRKVPVYDDSSDKLTDKIMNMKRKGNQAPFASAMDRR